MRSGTKPRTLQFIQWATGTQSLTTFAAHHGVTRQTMHHRFRWCWWIIPTPTIDPFRIHDQIFLDAEVTLV